MSRDYLTITRLVRKILEKVVAGNDADIATGDDSFVQPLKDEILDELMEIQRLWPKDSDSSIVVDSIDRIRAIKSWAPWEIAEIFSAIIGILNQIVEYYSQQTDLDSSDNTVWLHPRIVKSSYHHFMKGNYREAVLNAFVTVFDFLRQRTKLDLDGVKLAQTAYSPNSPMLIVSTMKTENGRSEQFGFMNLLTGAYSSFRNPVAHSMEKDLNKMDTFQSLVLASFLIRRIEESKMPADD